MEAEQEMQEDIQNEEEPLEEGAQLEQEEYIASNELPETKHRNSRPNGQGEDRSGFIHGLAVGLGIGCIATFVIVWISVFFTPQIPSITYENLLSIFVYPLIYLLAVGLIALTAGIVREYYATRNRY